MLRFSGSSSTSGAASRRGAPTSSSPGSSWPLRLPGAAATAARRSWSSSPSSSQPLHLPSPRLAKKKTVATAAAAATTAAPTATPGPTTTTNPPAPIPSLFGPAATAAAARSQNNNPLLLDTVVLVWFKHDLRTDDHPGLVAVEQALREIQKKNDDLAPRRRRVAAVVPVFALDPSLYAHLALTPDGPGALSASLARLRRRLRSWGSDLLVRWAPQGAAAALAEVAAAAAAAAALEEATAEGSEQQRALEVVVVAEREVEHAWLAEQERVAAAVQQAAAAAAAAAAASANENNTTPSPAPPPPRLRWVEWQAPVWPERSFAPYFRDWLRGRGAPHLPLAPADLGGGLLPASPRALLLQQQQQDAETPGEAAIAAALERALLEGSESEAVRSALRAAQGAAREGPGADAARRLLGELAPAMASGVDGDENDAADDPIALALAAYLDAGSPVTAAAAVEAADSTSNPQKQLRQSLSLLFPEAVAALESPAARGASYATLFGRWAQLGALSPRTAHFQAREWERRRWGGNPAIAALARRLGSPSPPAGAALVASELADFHAQLAAREAALADEPVRPSTPSAVALYMMAGGDGGLQGATTSMASAWSLSSLDEDEAGAGAAGGTTTSSSSFSSSIFASPLPPPSAWPAGEPQVRAWRWRGALTDYLVAHPPAGVAPALSADGVTPAPPLVIVHGFGAMSQQAAANARGLAERGFTVYAPTLPGFGRSEKAAIPYSQEAWRDFLRDFVSRAVGRPCVVAGNSIGGFISASLAADYPSLVKGLVLINSAGPIEPDFSAEAHARAVADKARKGPPPEAVARAATAALMAYLERTVPGQLEWLYPSDAAPARGWLADEIRRAAADGRAADVFGAVFYLPPPRALNFLVGELFKGPTLVLQGAADPLNDARGRAEQLGKLCSSNVDVVLMEGRGHCPHHEDAELANKELEAWVRRRVLGKEE
jgi:pimeloyl-ACP methyl ester carboxylesterase